MFFAVYRWFVWPALFAAFHVLGRFVPKIARGLELRARVDGRSPWVKNLPPAPPTVWIHCASGEFEYAKPVIALLKASAPSIKVVVTYFSPTYADAIRKFAGVDWVVPLPWDSPRPLSEFLDSYRPFALLVARTDVWPEMARQARLRGLKSVLFSATLTSGSRRTRGLGRWAARATLDQLDEIFAVTDDDVAAFRSLGLTHAHVSREGDTRYDQVLARLAQPKPVKEIVSGSRPLFVCGSTWPEDEAVLVPALASLSREVCGVLVPHEPTPEHVAELEDRLRTAGLTPIRYSALAGGATSAAATDTAAVSQTSSANLAAASQTSEAAPLLQPATCLIVDQMGILAELYLKARWAFVGGSFRKTVHSVMEPLAAGCVTFVGPLHTNNREAVAFQTFALKPVSALALKPATALAAAPDGAPEISPELAMVTCVRTSEELVAKLREAPDAREAITREVKARTGSSQKLVEWLKAQL